MKHLAIPAIVISIAACGASGPTETPPGGPLAGRYVLSQYDAKPLPTTLRVIAGQPTTVGGSGSFSCPEVLVGATLDIAADSTMQRTIRLAYPCTGTRPADIPDSLTAVQTGRASALGGPNHSFALEFEPSSNGPFPRSTEIAWLQAGLQVNQVRTGPDLSTIENLQNARVYWRE